MNNGDKLKCFKWANLNEWLLRAGAVDNMSMLILLWSKTNLWVWMWNTGCLCTAGMIESSLGKSSRLAMLKWDRKNKNTQQHDTWLEYANLYELFKRLEVKQLFFLPKKNPIVDILKGYQKSLWGFFINGNFCVIVTIAKATVRFHLLSQSASVYWFIQPFSVYLSSYSLSNPSCA